MRDTENMSSNAVPAFLLKLWALVENPTCDDLVCWDPSGKSFHVYDQGRFAKEVLPLYFKHSNIASFIRQLNMYGFRKVVHIDHGLKTESDDLEFQHPYFQQNNEHLLEHIKRKINNTPHIPPLKMDTQQVHLKSEDVTQVLNNVRDLRGKQESMNSKLDAVKRENELLWREVASLRQKHIKQQQIVNKLIQFMVHMVGTNRGVAGVKRKLPLMISDSEVSPSNKVARYGSSYTVQSPSTSEQSPYNSGVVIHEVDDNLNPPIPEPTAPAVNVNDTIPTNTTPAQSTMLKDLSLPDDVINPSTSFDGDNLLGDILGSSLVESSGDLSSSTGSNMGANLTNSFVASVENATNTADSLLSNQVSRPDNCLRPLTRQTSYNSAAEMNEQLDNLQVDIDVLKELLGAKYQMDPSHVAGLFNPETPVFIHENTDESNELKPWNYITGNELIKYKNDDSILDLLDLADLKKEGEEEEENNLLDQELNTKGLETPVVSSATLD